MSTQFNDIQGAMRQHLSTLPDSPPVAWENKNFDPDNNTLYLRAMPLPGNTVQRCLGRLGMDEHVGVFQVDVFIPDDDGRSEWPDKIADHFYREVLTVNDVDVRVRDISIGRGDKDKNFYIVPVSIPYQVFTHARTTP